MSHRRPALSSAATSSNGDAFSAIGCAVADDQASAAGRDVTIAVLDWGFDLWHPALRTADDRSRFTALFDQNQGGSPVAIEAIERHRRAALDAGRSPDWPDAYDPHANYYDVTQGAYGAHGTAMASIAAGSTVGTFSGLAPEAGLVGIQLAHFDPDWKEVDDAGRPTWRGWSPSAEPVFAGWRSYLESPELSAAVEHAYDVSRSRRDPALVILLAIGSWAGPHDGRSRLERTIRDVTMRSVSGEGPVTAVIVTAGNAAGLDGHVHAHVSAATPFKFAWRMWPADPTPNKLEIWSRGGALDIRLTSPDSDRSFAIGPGPTTAICLGDRLVGIADDQPGASGELRRCRIILHPPYMPVGLERDGRGRLAWTVSLATRDGEPPAEAHAWLERDDGEVERSTLWPPSPGSTLSGLATAAGAICVAGFDHRQPDALDLVSGRGPHPWDDRPDARVPHVAAPAHGIFAARSKTDQFITVSGTSAAGALAAGGLARLMSDVLSARRRDRGEARAGLVSAIDSFKLGRGTWNPSRGHGAIDIAAARREVTK